MVYPYNKKDLKIIADKKIELKKLYEKMYRLGLECPMLKQCKKISEVDCSGRMWISCLFFIDLIEKKAIEKMLKIKKENKKGVL